MKKFHVHVYKTEAKIDIDIEAEDAVEAKTKALEIAKKPETEWQESDCRFLAMDVE